MKVTVKLIGGFVHTVGFSERDFDVTAGTTVGGLLAMIPIDPSRPRLVSRDGWVIEAEEGLRDGDRLMVAPVYSGG